MQTSDAPDEPGRRRASSASVAGGRRSVTVPDAIAYDIPGAAEAPAPRAAPPRTKLRRPRSQGGLSRAVNSRLQLDATLSPSLTSLRLNPQNLRNEAKMHQGKYVSIELVKLRPRHRPAWSGPADVKLSRADRALVQRSKLESSLEDVSGGPSTLGRGKSMHLGKTGATPSAAAVTGGGSHKSQTSHLLKNAHNRSLTEARHTTEYVSWSKQVSQASTSALADIQTRKLMAKPRIQQVFNLLQDQSSGLLHKEQLDRALKAVGSSVLEQNLEHFVINEVFETLPEGTTGLTFKEFCTIVAALNERRHMALRERFEELDDDHSGEISMQEFRTLIWDLGFTVNQQEIEKLFAEVDTDGSGFIDFDEFEQAVSNSLENYGFTREEVREFEGLFDRYDQDRSGKLSPDELASALGWFGTPTSIAQAEELFELCGHFDGEPLTKSEFLRVIRIRLQQQIDTIRAQFAANDVDRSGTLDVSEVGDLVIELGYSTSQEALKECIRSVRSDAGKKGLVFEEVLELVEQLRRCEGFSEREVAELDQVFRLQDPANKGCLREFELGYAMQWLGYGISPSRRFTLMSAADVDKTGTIEFSEFLKVMRMVSEKEATGARTFLQSYGSRRSFSEVALRDLLHSLGYLPPKGFLNQVVKQCLSGLTRDMELEDILLVIRRVRAAEATRRQQCSGLPEEHASRLRSRFGRRVEAGKGIDPGDLVKFLMDLHPKARHYRHDVTMAENLANGAAQAKDGVLSMQDAFIVLQKFRHHMDEKQWQLQADIARRAGFSSQQVASFRELYISGDLNANGTLSLEELLKMLQGGYFPEVTPEGRQEMWRHANERDGAEHIDFAVFLEILETGRSSVRLENDRRSAINNIRSASKSSAAGGTASERPSVAVPPSPKRSSLLLARADPPEDRDSFRSELSAA
mmetsp:Transcript_31150/g.72546  ORF Transcript_31150/g.72546 Transcript_31150/m.72546 type:complete len:919 (-) Transcript_31150:94-2850(-)